MPHSRNPGAVFDNWGKKAGKKASKKVSYFFGKAKKVSSSGKRGIFKVGKVIKF